VVQATTPVVPAAVLSGPALLVQPRQAHMAPARARLIPVVQAAGFAPPATAQPGLVARPVPVEAALAGMALTIRPGLVLTAP
jgi:hypothetical protein